MDPDLIRERVLYYSEHHRFSDEDCVILETKICTSRSPQSEQEVLATLCAACFRVYGTTARLRQHVRQEHGEVLGLLGDEPGESIGKFVVQNYPNPAFAGVRESGDENPPAVGDDQSLSDLETIHRSIKWLSRCRNVGLPWPTLDDPADPTKLTLSQDEEVVKINALLDTLDPVLDNEDIRPLIQASWQKGAKTIPALCRICYLTGASKSIIRHHIRGDHCAALERVFEASPIRVCPDIQSLVERMIAADYPNPLRDEDGRLVLIKKSPKPDRLTRIIENLFSMISEETNIPLSHIRPVLLSNNFEVADFVYNSARTVSAIASFDRSNTVVTENSISIPDVVLPDGSTIDVCDPLISNNFEIAPLPTYSPHADEGDDLVSNPPSTITIQPLPNYNANADDGDDRVSNFPPCAAIATEAPCPSPGPKRRRRSSARLPMEEGVESDTSWNEMQNEPDQRKMAASLGCKPGTVAMIRRVKIGSRVDMYWKGNEASFPATVLAVDADNELMAVEYDDDPEVPNWYKMRKRYWLLHDENEPTRSGRNRRPNKH
jgi:hypothetical protein